MSGGRALNDTTTATAIPPLGFGTGKRRGEEGVAAITHALDVGYRHLDTAQRYRNETECGEAIARSGLPRADVFVTTKVHEDNLGPGLLRPSVEESLAKLRVDRVDLLLLHWPSPHDQVPMPVYLEQLAAVHDAGLTERIGLSNFTIPLLDEARGILGDRPISANQVEIHVYGQNRRLAARCRALGIPTIAFCPLGRGLEADDPVLDEIAATQGATWAQVALAFLMAEGHAVIPTSGKPERIAANFAARDVVLSDVEIARIRALDRDHHIVDDRSWMPLWD